MTGLFQLPEPLQQRLRSELRAGESIAWAAQPDPARRMKSAFKQWVFWAPWTAFSLYWIASAAHFRIPQSGEWSFPLFGLPFLLLGLGGMCSPLWMRRKAHSTVYAITNQRAIAIEDDTVKSYSPSGLTHLERTEHPDGTGDLILEAEHYKDGDGDSKTRHHGFFAIQDAKRVQQMVESLRARQA